MYYPVFIDLAGRAVLVIGGGLVAERKVESLLETGAAVTVVSPDATAQLQAWSAAGRIQLHLRPFVESDLEGCILTVSATDDPQVQRQIHAAAAQQKVLVNTVDLPALCDFIVPAVIRRGDVVIAISTSGKSPALAAALRARIEAMLPADIERVARVLGAAREEAQRRLPTPEARKEAFERVLASGILDWIQDVDDAAALERVYKIVRG